MDSGLIQIGFCESVVSCITLSILPHRACAAQTLYFQNDLTYSEDVENLFELDRWLLLKINRDWTTSFLDSFFVTFTDLHKSPYFPLFIVFILALIIWKQRRESVSTILGLVLALALSDFVGGKILKPAFDRTRPDQAGVEVDLKSPHYGGKSFPSNHAGNMFSAATYLSLVFPQGRVVFFSVAALVGYSRPYVGVHYPSDVFGGMIYGIICGLIAFYIKKRVRSALGRVSF